MKLSASIAEQHWRAIFEPFRRVVPLDRGAGLGLSLVSDIVLRHNGRITVGDAPGGERSLKSPSRFSPRARRYRAGHCDRSDA
ncbi:ATP-binding protein [Devosia geojensis]|uniref:ATP-binding protein n=1 Tax=Devosia geojensis TaxID=443610 RepID=UPI000B235C64